MKRFGPLVEAVLSLTAMPSVAAAQDQVWLQDRRYAEGIGIRTGNFEVHPGAALEFGYDSNYLPLSPEEHPVGSLRLRLTPSISFATLGPQRRGSAQVEQQDYDFRGGA